MERVLDSLFIIPCESVRQRRCAATVWSGPFVRSGIKRENKRSGGGVVDREGTSGLQRMRDDLMRDMLIRVAVGATAAKSRASCVYAKRKEDPLSIQPFRPSQPHAPHLRLIKIHAPPSKSVSY